MTPTSPSAASFSDENDYITAEDYGLELMKLSLTSSNVQHIRKEVEQFRDLVQQSGTEADKANFQNLTCDCERIIELCRELMLEPVDCLDVDEETYHKLHEPAQETSLGVQPESEAPSDSAGVMNDVEPKQKVVVILKG